MPDTPLTFVHSNRVERLADLLAVALRSMPEGAPLTPPSIVVPHVGLGRWLERALAERLGIAFGLRFALPGQFLWDLDRRLTGAAPPDDPYAVAPLALRILAALQGDAGSPDWEPLRRLAPAGDPAGRVAAATALAERYDRYLMHWPDLLRGWERAPDPGRLPWQGRIWRTLRLGGGEPQRLAMLRRVGTSLARRAFGPGQLPDALHLFGLHLMPAPYWQVFDALANEVPTIVYLPDPSKEPSLDYGAAEGDPGDVAHPLLDRLGALQRGFLRLAFAGERARELRPYPVEPGSASLLQRLQRSLFERSTAPLQQPCAAGDDSLGIHQCGGPWREVEVLRDELIRRFQADATLKLADVVVMVPDPGAYAACFAQVFAHEDPELRLPYQLVDRGGGAETGLLSGFVRLLRPGPRRTTLAEVLALAASAEVRARFELEEDELDACASWLAEAGVRWGLDRAERMALEAGDDPDGSFELAARRMLLGYAHGEGALELDGVAPLALAEGQGAAALGRLLALLEQLRELRLLLARELPTEQWPTALLERYDALYAAAGDDTCERERARLAVALARLARDAEVSGQPARLPGGALHALLDARIERDDGGLPSGVITVCGMVPLRSVPFRVVALLGLDADAFPRRERARPFECVSERRLGERGMAQDDRHAFLEAILSARDALHLSYNARDPASGTEQDPSAVLDELSDLLQAQVPLEDGRPWECRHPDAPFDPAVFHPPSTGYARHWAAAGANLTNPTPPVRFASLPSEEAPVRTVWAVPELARCLVQPARHWLRRTRVRMEAPEHEQWEESGDIDGLVRYQKLERALELVRAGLDDRDALARQLLREGCFPPGVAGRRKSDQIVEQALALHGLEQTHAQGREREPRTRYEFQCAGRLIEGTSAARYGERLLIVRPGKLHARACFGAWLDGLAARTAGAPIEEVVLIGLMENEPACRRIALDAEALEELPALVALAERAEREPLPLFPESGSEFVEAWREGGDQRAALGRAYGRWKGSQKLRGEREDGDIAWYVRDWPDPLAPPFAELALALHAPRLARTRAGA